MSIERGHLNYASRHGDRESRAAAREALAALDAVVPPVQKPTALDELGRLLVESRDAAETPQADMGQGNTHRPAMPMTSTGGGRALYAEKHPNTTTWKDPS